MTIDPKEVPVPKFHGLLLGAVSPRPIAFASTIDLSGNVNLSPFSFFNCFGANPPLLVFSPARRARDNSVKHTYENVLEVPEVVINIVNYSMVQQASLASSDYPRGVNEFVKAGFTEIPSERIRPPRVKESPVSMECRVTRVIHGEEKGGAGNLVICEVILMHVNEAVLDSDGRIDPHKLDAVARLGGDFYARISGDSIFKVPRPVAKPGIGIDQLPAHIRNSSILTGNDLGMLANVEKIPEDAGLPGRSQESAHREAKALLGEGKIPEAWQVLLAGEK